MISLLFFLNVILAQEIKRLTIGQRIEGFQAKWLQQNGDYYEIILEELKTDSDIVVMVKSINPGGDPNIFISKVNKYAKNEIEGEIASCSSRGNDLCIIDKSQLLSQIPYYISIICPGNCRYELRVDYVEEYILNRSDFIQFKLTNTQQSEIIRINTGYYSNSETELEIEIKALNIYEFENEFQVYLNQGNDIPSSISHQYKAKDSWSGSQLITLSFSDLPFQSNLTMLISGQAGAIIQVKTHTYGLLRELRFQEVYNGLVEAQKVKIFKIKIQDQSYNDEDDHSKKIKWYVKLTPFIGHATLHVNPDYQPHLLEQYLYSSEQQSRSVFILNKSYFKHQYGDEKYLFVAIFGNEMCTYQLETGILDYEYQYIDINVPYEGILENNDLTNYWFVLTGNKAKAVTVELTNYGEECAMVLQKCSEDNCKINEEDLQNLEDKYSDNERDLFIYSNATKNNNKQLLAFNYAPNTCQSFGDLYSCTYALAIYQNTAHIRQQESKCIYSLIVSSLSSHIKLRENTPHKSLVERNNYNYFKFKIEEDQNIIRISVLLTPIQGKFKIYSSLQDQRPNQQSFDKQGINNMIRYGYDNQIIQKGTYYISVFGETAGLYTITVVVIRDGEDLRQKGSFAWQYIQLYEGSPQDFLLFNDEVGLYKIDLVNYLGLDQDRRLSQDTLKVEILHESGDLRLFGFDHPTANLSQSRWNSSGEIEIQMNEGEQLEVIYLRVEPNKPLSVVQFRIIYRIGWKNYMLVLDENFYTFIEKDDYQYFYFTFFKNEDVQLTKRAHSHKDDEVIVTAFVGDQQYQLTSGSMVLSPSSMPLDKCKISDSEIYYCQVQIQVTSTVSTFYSLLISKDQSQIQLSIDEPVIKTLPVSYHHYYLFYQSINDVIINVVNYGYPQPLQILVSYFNVYQYPNQGNYDYPTNLESKNLLAVSKTLIGLSHSQVTLNSESLQFCQQYCVLAITVKLIEDLQYFKTPKSTYSIQYSSGAITLPESQPLYGTVQKNVIKYYLAYVQENNTNLMILLTPMSSCDTNMVVSKSRYPDADQYDWTSQDYLGDQLIIENGNPKYPDMAGLYYIGVISSTVCSYSIVYQTGMFHYYQIQQGVPYNIVLQQGEIAYFKYEQYVAEQFKILFMTQGDTAQYYIEEMFEESKESNTFLKQVETFQYNNGGKGYKKQFSLTPYDGHKYLIAVVSQYYSRITIAVQVKSNIIYLAKDATNINQLDPKEFQNYNYYTQSDTDLHVLILSGKISIQYRSNSSQIFTEKILHTERYSESQFQDLIQVSSNNSNIFEIKITALEDSATYKIYCKDHEGPVKVNIGEVYNVVLPISQSKKFIYNSVQNGYGSTFCIFLTYIFNEYSIDDYNKYKLKSPTVKVIYTYQDSNQREIYPTNNAEFSKYYYIEFADSVGDYEIEIINNNGQTNMQYSIIFGNSLLNVLIPSHTIYNINQKPQYWEYFCPTEGQLIFQIKQCGSPINLFGSTDIDLLRNSQYQKQYKILDTLVDIIEVKRSGYYYLLTIPVFSQSNLNSQYTINAQLVKQDSYIPINDIKPGDDGNLYWTIEKRDDKFFLNVSFYQLSIKENINFKIQQIQYKLIYYFIEEDNDLPFNQCLDIYQFQSFIQSSSQEKQMIFSLYQELDVEKLENSQMIYFNVYTDSIIQLKNQEMIHLEKFYIPRKIQNQYVKQIQWYHYLQQITVLSIILTILYVLYRHCRKKDIQQQNRFESNEYPNIEMHYRGLSE